MFVDPGGLSVSCYIGWGVIFIPGLGDTSPSPVEYDLIFYRSRHVCHDVPSLL